MVGGGFKHAEIQSQSFVRRNLRNRSTVWRLVTENTALLAHCPCGEGK